MLVGLVAAVVCCGCAGPTDPHSVLLLTQEPDRPLVEPKTTPVEGLYVIRREPPGNPGRDQPYAVALPSGTWIGFERDADGALVAVAGESRIALGDGVYQWRYVPPPRDRTPLENVGMVLVAVPAIAVVLIMATLVPGSVPRC
jgi:hypothetical protein